MDDISGYPINYNHYYTDNIQKVRDARRKKSIADCLEKATTLTHLPGCNSDHSSASIDIGQALENYSRRIDRNMENLSCEEALDCLFAIYKVYQKTFIANITFQVIERHMVRGLERIFSPVAVNDMSDSEVERITSEPASANRQKDFLQDRIKKLEYGSNIPEV